MKLHYLLMFVDIQDMGLILYGMAVLLCFFVYKLVDFILRQPRLGRYTERYVFITGCDSGFGYSLAVRLYMLGCYVFAGHFTEDGERALKKICSERMHTVPLDVTDHDSISRAFEQIHTKLQSTGLGEHSTRLIPTQFDHYLCIATARPATREFERV